jgi:hypothetical protein
VGFPHCQSTRAKSPPNPPRISKLGQPIAEAAESAHQGSRSGVSHPSKFYISSRNTFYLQVLVSATSRLGMSGMLSHTNDRGNKMKRWFAVAALLLPLALAGCSHPHPVYAEPPPPPDFPEIARQGFHGLSPRVQARLRRVPPSRPGATASRILSYLQLVSESDLVNSKVRKACNGMQAF